MKDRDPIDRVIDDVARRLTAGGPPAPMRARVVERLTTDRTRAAAWIVPAIAVAALVIAIVVGRSHRGVVAPAIVTEAPAVESSPQQSASDLLAVQERAEVRRGAAAAPRAAMPGPERVAVPIDESALGALAPPPLNVPAIAVDRIEPAAPIALSPLADVAPLAIAPLDELEGDRR